MFSLNKETKEKFQKQVSKIDANDESKVKNNIEKEIAILEKKVKNKPSHNIQSLIDNTKLLYEILENKPFPISESTRKWIIFGLGYLVSDIDLIPDSIPNIGYLDDAMIVSWVLSMIDEDITRYEFFKKAQKLSTKGNVIKELVQGNGEQLFILLPGFIEDVLDKKEEALWLKTMRKINSGFSSPGFSIINWNISYLREINQLVPIIDHKLTLKPVFDFEKTQINWQQLKIDMMNIGKALKLDLENIRKSSPNKEIIIIALNISSFIITSALNELDNNIINKIYLLGSASTEDDIQHSIPNKVTHMYNFYSKNDHAIKFICDNLEENNIAVGLKFLQANRKVMITNIDASKEILRHHDYKFKLSQLINNINS